MEEKQNVTVHKEETKILDPSPLVDGDGNAVNLTGTSITWEAYDGDDSLIKKTKSDTITVTDATAGNYEIKIEPSDTTGVDPGIYEHQAFIVDSTGNKSPVMEGSFALRPSRIDD